MSGTIITVVALLIGLLILGAGIYYLVKEKDDKESRKIYLITIAAGLIIVIGIIIKIIMNGL